MRATRLFLVSRFHLPKWVVSYESATGRPFGTRGSGAIVCGRFSRHSRLLAAYLLPRLINRLIGGLLGKLLDGRLSRRRKWQGIGCGCAPRFVPTRKAGTGPGALSRLSAPRESCGPQCTHQSDEEQHHEERPAPSGRPGRGDDFGRLCRPAQGVVILGPRIEDTVGGVRGTTIWASSSPSSRALCGLSAGSLARQRMMSASKAGGRDTCVEGRSGISVSCLVKIISLWRGSLFR